MGARVDNRIGRVIVGQEGIFAIAIKGEDQDFHAGEAKFLTKIVNIGGDFTQVFGDDGQLSQGGLNALEKRLTGGRYPASIDSGFFVARNLPISGEAAKVIQTNNIHHREYCREAINPPGKVLSLVHIPAIDGVAPTLPGGREIIWRHSGDDRWLPDFVQVE